MSYNYYLSVAGIKIFFESCCSIIVNEEFKPFLVEEMVPDIHSVILKTNDLPKIPKKPLYSDMFCSVAKNKDGYQQKFFFENRNMKNCYAVSTYNPNNKNILIEYPDSYDYSNLNLRSCFYWLGFEEILLRKRKLCLHAACVDTPLGGILFSGVSGIGKSTQAELWCKYRGARQINGDRPILSKEEKGWMAWGSPYAGSSKYYVNKSCAISAIVLLKQASNCSFRRLTQAEAFRGVWAGLTIHSWDLSFVEDASILNMDLIKNVPIFEFSCTPDEAAVEYLEKVLRKEYDL